MVLTKKICKFIFTARRRLSKTLSPDRDVESQPNADASENNGSITTDESYPIGKPLEVNNFVSLSVSIDISAKKRSTEIADYERD